MHVVHVIINHAFPLTSEKHEVPEMQLFRFVKH